ncbi:MAG: Holliday junction branch migration protein RuvA [Firmicutes bacterium]|nr:Holliday junction branch migration protein RuvA [Bacillota bacterium]
MIKYIRGYYAMTLPSGIVVETPSGIGFEINVPAGSPLYKYGEGEEVKVFTAMIVKEDDVSLYGFHNRESLDFFRMLITVSGIGAKGAMAIMGSMSVDELRRAIMFEDVKEISKANGVGKKTAERLILELKDKVGKLDIEGVSAADMTGITVSGGTGAEDSGDSRTEAIQALVALGYSKAEAFGAVAKVPEDNLTSEEYIKKALKSLF